MGAQASRNMKPEEFAEFRRLDTGTTNLDLEVPEKAENRSPTNKNFTYIYIISLLITIALMIYTLAYVGDAKSGGGSYYTKTESIYGPRHSSFDEDDFVIQLGESFTSILARNWWKFILSFLIAIALAMVMLVLLRYFTGAVVWTCLILALVLAAVVVLCLWIAAINLPPEQKSSGMVTAVIATIVLLVVICVFVFLYKRIPLVILLFREAATALFQLPGLFTVTIIHLLFYLIVIIIFCVTQLYMEFVYNNERIGNIAMGFAMILGIVMFVWTVQFLVGFQCTVVAGTIATWYFARNKQFLNSPIKTTISNIFRFHLGSIFFGSFIITFVILIKMVINALTKNEKVKKIVLGCLSCIEDIIKYLTKNAYIVMAIHGQPFWRSGKRAAKLLATNAIDMVAVNQVGDTVLAILVLFLMLINGGISYLLFINEAPHTIIFAIICFVFSGIVIVPISSLFETCVDSLFICFCEDKEINDGIARPYCMPRGLMEFMDRSKQFKAAQNS